MKSFITYAKNCDFPIENLPYGIFSTKYDETHRIGVAIGDQILDLSKISHLFTGEHLRNNQHVFKQPVLNDFMGLAKPAWLEARQTIQSLLSVDNKVLQDDNNLRSEAIIPQTHAIMHVPARVGDYTDFYSNIYHATNCGLMFFGSENPLTANWKYMPLGYHGRSSSIVISGTPIHRPYGQILPIEGQAPQFSPCELMDFELEMAFFVGGPETKLGKPIPINEADEHIFGMVLMNDWSARDIQRWEMAPLGPFTSKNLATTISPWVVTTFALEPFLVDNFPQDPVLFPYLKHEDKNNYDIKLFVDITPSESKISTTICRSNYKYNYWTQKQHLAHHTITGCNVKPGDMMGSGTISGNNPDSFGCMLELAWKGTKPIHLTDGSVRKFLLNGDTVTLRGVCEGKNYNIGFGSCTGQILPEMY